MDPAAVEREKALLRFGWGRFGKSLQKLPDLLDPEEELLAACVGLNPTFEHRSITVAGGLRELTKSTNLLLAATDRRLVLIATGAGGAPREHSHGCSPRSNRRFRDGWRDDQNAKARRRIR